MDEFRRRLSDAMLGVPTLPWSENEVSEKGREAKRIRDQIRKARLRMRNKDT